MQLKLAIFASMLALAAQTPSITEDRLLASQKMQSGGSEETLMLYEREIPKPSTAARLRYIMHTKPAAGADSNLAFFIVVTDASKQYAPIAWITYETASEYVRPKPIFKVALQPAQQAKSADLWLVLTEELGGETRLKIYDIDSTKQVAKAPISLDPERKEEWPKPSQPNSRLSYIDPVGTVCAISDLGFTSSDEGIAIHALREPKGCRPLEAALDISKRTWVKVDVQKDHNP